MLINWFQFLVSAAIIILAGAKMTHYADAIAERTGIGRGFIGVLMLGLATSLPEVFTSGSAVILFDAKDLAVGNLLGSCAFNLLIVAIADVFFRLGPVSGSPLTTLKLSIAMAALVGVAILVGDSVPSFYMHPGSIVILVAYFVSLRWIYVAERAEDLEEVLGESGNDYTPAGLVVKSLIAASVLIGSSIWMSAIADELAFQTGLGGTLIGAFAVAAATSLPELAVSITALRMGQVSMFLGNVFGSNIFNIGILGLIDVAYGREGLFDNLPIDHLVIVAEVILISFVLLIGLRRKPAFRILRLAPDRLLSLGIYVATTWLLFYNRISF